MYRKIVTTMQSSRPTSVTQRTNGPSLPGVPGDEASPFRGQEQHAKWREDERERLLEPVHPLVLGVRAAQVPPSAAAVVLGVAVGQLAPVARHRHPDGVVLPR